MKKVLLNVGILFILFSGNLKAQQKDSSENYTPYELMSSYYNEDFKPFKKKNAYFGLAFSLEDRKQTNSTNILETVIDGERLNYDISLKGGYYTGNYGMAGLNVNYYQRKFIGEVFRDPDTLQSNTISRGYAFTPNFRSSVPLTDNERLSFFTEVGLTFGFGNSLKRTIKNLDEVDKVYSTDFNFRIGISPGITFFAMESFAFEIQLNVLGYELQVSDKSVNEEEDSRVIQQSVDFNIDILSLELGLAYFFGSKK
jgi:hypothetical protein